jgi:CYTH domain-containing protein
VFHGALEGLYFAEIEFGSEEEAEAYVMPDWFLKDVTFDRRYSNAVMTRYQSLEALMNAVTEK